MSLYLSATGTFKLGTDSSLAELMAARSLSMTEGTDHEEAISHMMEVPDASGDVAVSLGPLTTCKALMVKTDRKITIKIDGTNAVVLGHTAGEEAWLILPATSLTSLAVNNASGGVANVHIVMAGV